MKKLPSKLYHYCSVESMFNIIKSRSLWLSNSKQMNDAEESTWIEQYFPYFIERFEKINQKKLINEAIDFYKDLKEHPFIFCLSEDKDSLSQWRAYSKNGQGVSICFKSDILDLPNIIPGHNRKEEETIGLIPIVYDETRQSEYMYLVYKVAIDIFKKKKDNPITVLFLGISLSQLSRTFKNHSFSEEKEWRIIYTPIKFKKIRELNDEHDSSNTTNLLSITDQKFRVSNEKIISFYELSLSSKFTSDLIPEIILGPKSQIDIPELELFIKANGLENTKIIRSKSTYR